MDVCGVTLVLLLAQADSNVGSVEGDLEPLSAPEPVGLNVGLTMTSIVNDRGSNFLSSGPQNDHHLAFVPSLEYSIASTGIYVGYEGFFRATGERTDVETNASQILLAGVRRNLLNDTLVVDTNVGVTLMPLAQGVDVPGVVEPAVGATWMGPVELSFWAIYSYAVPSEWAGDRHVYLQPAIARSFGLDENLSLLTSTAAGYKVFERAESADRVFDVATQVGLEIRRDWVTVLPALNAAWVDINDLSFEDEYMVWASVGLDIGL